MQCGKHCHTYRRHILAAIALACDEQGAFPQVFVLSEEALQADVDVCCNLELIRGNAPLACMDHFELLIKLVDERQSRVSLHEACYSPH